MNCPVEYDGDVERRLTHHLLLPKYESDKGVVSLEKNTIEKAVVNCGVEVRKDALRKGNNNSMYQRARKQLEQQRSVLGYKSGYNNGHTSKYPSDTLNGYKGTYPANTKARTVDRYMASAPYCRKKMSATRQLLNKYETRSHGRGYKKQ